MPDLSSLTGIRSGKRSYYREYRRSSERLESAVRSLDELSLSLVHTAEGPRALLTAALHAAAQHLGAQWAVLAIADRSLPSSRPRYLATDQDGRLVDTEQELDPVQRYWLHQLRADPPAVASVGPGGVVVVPMTVDGEPVGGIAARAAADVRPEPMDLSVLRILVNQAAVALHAGSLYHSSVALQTRTEQLAQEASQQARDLAWRRRELHTAQELLAVARRREIVDGERQRIARELHDSVTQHVLSAGMMLEVCRTETERLGASGAALAGRIGEARDLTRQAVGQLRAAIYALHRQDDVATPLLPRLLAEACRTKAGSEVHVVLRIEGSPVSLGVDAEESLARLAGEALFNVRVHAEATRCVVRLAYRCDWVSLSVDDDGSGSAAGLRSQLRVAQAGDVDGCGRGLVNMAGRAAELGGGFALRRSRLGGIRAQVRIPLRDETRECG